MLSRITLTGTDWQAITSPGEIGTVFIENSADYGGNNTVVLTHSATKIPGALDPYVIIPSDATPNAPVLISPDSSTDIFYARCSGGSFSILVDVI